MDIKPIYTFILVQGKEYFLGRPLVEGDIVELVCVGMTNSGEIRLQARVKEDLQARVKEDLT